MKRTLLTLLIAIATIPLNAFTVSAQEAVSAERLKEEIRKLEMIARDESHSPEVKEMNSRFLAGRRVRLSELLEKRVNSLNEYLRTAGPTLSAREVKIVEEAINNLKAELEAARSGQVTAKPDETTARREFRDAASSSGFNVRPVSMVMNTTPAPLPVQSENREIKQTALPKELSGDAKPFLRLPTAAIINAENARDLIKAAFRAKAFTNAQGNPLPSPVPDEQDFPKEFHCIIHVLRWNDLANPSIGVPTSGEQTVAAQNWYVYNNGDAKGLRSDGIWSQEDLATSNRIYGVKKVWLLYIHLNKWKSVKYTAHYDFNIVKRTPANVANLLALAKVFAAFTNVDPLLADTDPPNHDVWGGGLVETNYVPSDVTVTANITRDLDKGPFTALDKPKKFDNEGLYYWDVSVGVPIRRIKQLEFDTVNNTVAAKEVDKQNAFALVNIYLPPKDITGTGFSWIPHFVGGVAIAKQPLKKFMVGAGFGPHFANFYLGALFTEVKEPANFQPGSMATPDQLNADLRKRFKSQFTFGVNIPVRAVLKTLDKDKE